MCLVILIVHHDGDRDGDRDGRRINQDDHFFLGRKESGRSDRPVVGPMRIDLG